MIPVLVIDDSELARAQIRKVLESAGFAVLEQPSGIGATRTILSNDVKAVVVDISMPGLSGDKLVRVLRENPRLRGLIIIVVSGKPEGELSALRDSLGAHAVLSKGELDFLVPALQRHLRRTPLETAGSGSYGIDPRQSRQ
jgi:CheY-like chemotaxis protein